MREKPYRLALLPAVALLLVSLAGCARHAGTHASGTPIRVTERDFHIYAPARVRAGTIRFVVHNRGPDDHEFLVVRAGGPRLPIRSDGLTVDEDHLGKAKLGTIEPAQPRTAHELRVRLAPGRYELFCNMYGHFASGMRRTLVVE